jgi:predicted  nucleic acid-binding Zn-ribbon protein
METRKREHPNRGSSADNWFEEEDNRLAEETARGPDPVPKLLHSIRQRNRELTELRTAVKRLRDRVRQLEHEKDLLADRQSGIRSTDP